MEGWRGYIVTGERTQLYQLVTGFAMGLIFGPLSGTIGSFLFWLVVYEIFVMWVTRLTEPWWQFEVRVALNCAYFLGWVLGRWLLLGHIGIESLSGLPERVFSPKEDEDDE